MTVEIISDLARFREIENDWRELCDACASGPFVGFDWINAWAKVFGSREEAIRIVTLREDGLLIAALPLAVRRKRISHRLPFRTRTLTPLANEREGDHEVLIRPGHEHCARDLLKAMRDQGRARYMDLTPMRATPSYRVLCESVRENAFWTHERAEITTRIANIPDGWDAYVAARSRSLRKGIRRRARREAEPEFRSRTVCRATPEGLAVLNDAFEVSSKSWKARTGTDIGTAEEDRNFIQTLFEANSERQAFRLTVFYCEDVPISFFLFLCEGHTSYGLITDYREDYETLGPGRHAVEIALRNELKLGIERFDMLRETSMTSSYCDETENLMRLRVALRPSLAPLVIVAESRARDLVRWLGLSGPQVTGRRKFFRRKGDA